MPARDYVIGLMVVFVLFVVALAAFTSIALRVFGYD